jgi:signal transduction histidine kinase
VRSIAKKHGGRAYALSEGEGQGTTLVIELPQVQPPPAGGAE